jgi:hypothetical protein
MTNFAVRGMTAVSKKCAGGDRGLERESWKTRAKTTLEQIERVSRGSLIGEAMPAIDVALRSRR